MQNHFKTLGVDETFTIDTDALHRAYLQAQQASHPDRQAGKTDAEKQMAALESATANDAYRILKDDYLRAVHLLEVKGIRVQGDHATVQPDNMLLMEVMEWNEAVEEVRGVQASELLGELQAKREKLLSLLTQLVDEQTVIRLGYLEKSITNLTKKVKGLAA